MEVISRRNKKYVGASEGGMYAETVVGYDVCYIYLKGLREYASQVNIEFMLLRKSHTIFNLQEMYS